LEESKQKILLIDDDKTLCEVLGEELEQENYSVTCSFSGKDGLSRLSLGTYNLVILDYNMPEMDGYEVLVQVKRIFPMLPVMIITGDADIEIQRKFVDIGANDFVKKPFEFEEFLMRVRQCILKN
jgi:DNA-binding response OmpR family regulator